MCVEIKKKNAYFIIKNYNYIVKAIYYIYYIYKFI